MMQYRYYTIFRIYIFLILILIFIFLKALLLKMFIASKLAYETPDGSL